MTHSKPDGARLANVPMDIVVELARKEVTLGEARRFDTGDIIAFDKLAGEAFEITINGRMYAEGEIVVVTDLMAVRITRLIDTNFEVSP